MPIFLDSNVFLYAVGAEHPLRGPCGRILESVASGAVEATTSSEVIQEILDVLRRKGRPAEAHLVARRVAQLLPDLLPVGRSEVLRAIDFLEQVPGLSVRDAVHAATALGAGITRIASADQDFDRVDGLTRLEPGEFPWTGAAGSAGGEG